MFYTASYDSPAGRITMAGDGERLTGLWFEGQRHFGSTLTGPCTAGSLPLFDDVRRWLDIYFSGREPDFLPPLRLLGTPFRIAVWEQLLRIPFGRVVSYRQLADALAAAHAMPAAAPRAVGGAVGRNPIALLVPCHRVVGSDGSLTGYAGGVETKARLLALEGVAAGTLPDPLPPFRNR